MPPIDTVTGVRTTGVPVAVPPPLGKVQLRLVPTAVNVKVPPVQTGLGLAVTLVGAAGLDGSVNVNGPPNTFEVQPLSVTDILVYVPAVKPLMVNWPLPLLVKVCGVCAVPFLLKFTV